MYPSRPQILNLMAELRDKYKLTYVFISHNLSVVAHVCDRIAVMYLGNIVGWRISGSCLPTLPTPIPRPCWTPSPFQRTRM